MAVQPPQYTPLANGSVVPGKNYPVYFGNSQMTPPGLERPLTYQEFLASRGMGQGNYQAGAQQPDMMSSAEDIVKKYGEKEGQGYLESLMSGGSSAAAGGESSLMASGAGVGVADAAGAATTFSSGTSIAGTAVGSAPGGGTLMSTGAVVPASAGTPIASSGGAAAGSGAFSLSGIGGAGNAILPLVGAAGLAELYSSNRGARNRPVGAAQGAASGAAMGSYFGPWGTGIGAVLGGVYGGTQHESTREGAKRRTQGLLKDNKDDPVYQAFARGMREQFESGPPDPSKPFAGKYATFDEYEKAGLEAGDLTGVNSNIKLGSKYAALTPEERVAFTQRAINEVGYSSKKGEVFSKDEKKLNSIFEDYLKNKTGTSPLKISGPTGQDASGIVLRDSTSNAPAPIMIPRSKTKSPGIGLDGKPISQWRR